MMTPDDASLDCRNRPTATWQPIHARVEPDDASLDCRTGQRQATFVKSRRIARGRLDATAELTVSLRAGGVAERIQIIFRYLHAMQDQAAVDAFAEALRHHGDRQGGGVMTQMTYIERVLEQGLEQGREEGREQGLEQGREEGREEGVQRAKVEMVDGLLKHGVQWDVITPATGIDESRFHALKERLTVAAQGDEQA